VDQIIQLAEMLSIPVVASLSGKGVMIENHPLCVDVVAHIPGGVPTAWLQSRSGHLHRKPNRRSGHQWVKMLTGTSVIQIDIDPSELGRTRTA
jgi:thiamine pyrophosphate-dependent acetolactate synthase large subunit-like protein